MLSRRGSTFLHICSSHLLQNETQANLAIFISGVKGNCIFSENPEGRTKQLRRRLLNDEAKRASTFLNTCSRMRMNTVRVNIVL